MIKVFISLAAAVVCFTGIFLFKTSTPVIASLILSIVCVMLAGFFLQPYVKRNPAMDKKKSTKKKRRKGRQMPRV